MWGFRKMQPISWTEHITNEQVLRRMHRDRDLVHNINCKTAYFGRVMHNTKTHNGNQDLGNTRLWSKAMLHTQEFEKTHLCLKCHMANLPRLLLRLEIKKMKKSMVV